MNILSIGNSFSCDAHRYLHKIAKADGVELNTFNLYIGGCSLDRHYRNMLSDNKSYVLEMNGKSTGFFVSLKEALLNREWDIITIQQVSSKASNYETYQPYINKLIEYVRMCSPKAKIGIHQTWAYEKNSQRLNVELGYDYPEQMFVDVKSAIKQASKDINADFIIPSGEVFNEMTKQGIENIHRDTFHASLGKGRYALGLIWYSIITKNDVLNNSFCDFDEEIPNGEISVIQNIVSKISDEYRAI